MIYLLFILVSSKSVQLFNLLKKKDVCKEMIILLIILHVLAFACYKVYRFFSYWKDRNVPQYNIFKIIYKTVIDLFHSNPIVYGQISMYNDFKNHRYYGTYEFLTPRLFIRDVELLKQLTIRDFDYFVDHTEFIPLEGDPILENSLFTVKGEKWREIRAGVSPIFNNTKMKMILNVIRQCSTQLREYIEEKSTESTEFEMRDLLGRLTNDVIVTTIFGLECNSLKNPNNQFFKTVVPMTKFSGIKIHLKYILMKVVPEFCKKVNIRFLSEKTCLFYKRLITDTIRMRKERQIIRPDMINLLIEAQKEKEVVPDQDDDSEFPIQKGGAITTNNLCRSALFTDDVTTALVINFHGAGYDSVVTLLSFMAYELAVNPEAQEKLHQEIDMVYEAWNGEPPYDELKNMKYLNMCISETLRKWPGAIFIERSCTKPYTIEPTNPQETPIEFKVGDPFSLALFGLHYDERYYRQPEKFIPERFTDENRSKMNPYVYVPFGIGPRYCIGNRYALIQAKVCFFYFLHEFYLTPSKKTETPLKIARKYFQLGTQNGIWANINKRSY